MKKVIWLVVLFIVSATAGVLSQETGRQFLRKIGYSTMIESIRADAVHAEKADRDIEVAVYAVKENLAAVKTTSRKFYDYLLMAKIDGQWKLINVLWQYNPDWPDNPGREQEGDKPVPDPGADKAAVEQACLDYIEGYFSGDAGRMERALHPELTKIRPQVLDKTGKTLLDKSGAELLIEATRTRAGYLEETERKIEYTLLDYKQDIAMVEALSRRSPPAGIRTA